MKIYEKELVNKKKTKIVLITRRKFPEGFNYYLALLKRNEGPFTGYHWVDSGQKGTITSEKAAIQKARELLK